jgi:hypothetical protein
MTGKNPQFVPILGTCAVEGSRKGLLASRSAELPLKASSSEKGRRSDLRLRSDKSFAVSNGVPSVRAVPLRSALQGLSAGFYSADGVIVFAATNEPAWCSRARRRI